MSKWERKLDLELYGALKGWEGGKVIVLERAPRMKRRGDKEASWHR